MLVLSDLENDINLTEFTTAEWFLDLIQLNTECLLCGQLMHNNYHQGCNYATKSGGNMGRDMQGLQDCSSNSEGPTAMVRFLGRGSEPFPHQLGA